MAQLDYLLVDLNSVERDTLANHLRDPNASITLRADELGSLLLKALRERPGDLENGPNNFMRCANIVTHLASNHRGPRTPVAQINMRQSRLEDCFQRQQQTITTPLNRRDSLRVRRYPQPKELIDLDDEEDDQPPPYTSEPPPSNQRNSNNQRISWANSQNTALVRPSNSRRLLSPLPLNRNSPPPYTAHMSGPSGNRRARLPQRQSPTANVPLPSLSFLVQGGIQSMNSSQPVRGPEVPPRTVQAHYGVLRPIPHGARVQKLNKTSNQLWNDIINRRL